MNAGLTRRIGLAPRRAIWFAVGSCSLLMGALGVVLPVLPTTPFVILAAFAFGKSAPSIQRRLEGSRLFGPIIADWRASGAIAPRYKATALLMMAGVLGLSVAMSVSVLVLSVQAVCMVAAAAFVLSRPSAAAGRSPPDG